MTNTKSFIPTTKTFYVLVTGNTARLVFYSKESAEEYVKSRNGYEGTTIQKVYGETEIIEVTQN